MIGIAPKLTENFTFKREDYLLMVLLIQIGVLVLLVNIEKLDFILIPIAFYILYKRKGTNIFNIKFLLLLAIFILLSLVQGLVFGSLSVITIITSFSMIFLLPYFVYKIYRFDFLFLFEKVVSVLIYISLSIWILQQFIPGVQELIVRFIISINRFNVLDHPRFMFVYTYWLELEQYFGLSRNAGFNNEPAAFAVVIIFSIIIRYVRNIQLLDKRNIVYYVALLTTFSTTGYIALAVLGLLFLKQRKGKIIGILLFPIFIYGAIYSYRNLEFLQGKIESDYSSAMEKKLDQTTSGRIYGARKSILVLTKYPVFGRGLQNKTKPDVTDPEFAGSGWLGEMSKYGILFGGLFMFYFLKGIKRFIESGRYGSYEFAVCTLSIMILLSAQNGITGVFFMVFFYFGLYNYKIPNNANTYNLLVSDSGNVKTIPITNRV